MVLEAPTTDEPENPDEIEPGKTDVPGKNEPEDPGPPEED